jgi:SSS family solute:Na+ symporter
MPSLFAALTAAIVASLAGKANSIATIFSLDIYKKAFKPDASEAMLVKTGKYTVIVSMLIAIVLALFLGEGLMGEGKQGFQYIQEYSGFISPGVFAMFILGFFWKKTSSNAALFAIIGGFILSLLLKFLPEMVNLSFLSGTGFSKVNAKGIYEIPFLDRMGFVFLFCVLGMVIISINDLRKGIQPKSLVPSKDLFKTDMAFNIGALLVIGILAALFTVFW